MAHVRVSAALWSFFESEYEEQEGIVSDVEKLKRVTDRLLSKYRSTDEGSEVDPAAIREIIAEDPEAVAGAFPVMARGAREADLPIWGLLWVVSEMYEDVTGGDDSLVLILEDEMGQAGVELPNAQFKSHASGNEQNLGDSEVDQRPKTVVLEIAPDDLRAGSAYRMVRFFSVENMESDTLQNVLGRCMIAFPVDDDPRPIWEIPEVRSFMQKLHNDLPYFPMYLDFDPRLQQHLTYYGCLADSSAMEKVDGGVRLHLEHPSVVSAIHQSIIGIRRACQTVGIDSGPFETSLIQVYDVSRQQLHFGTLLN